MGFRKIKRRIVAAVDYLKLALVGQHVVLKNPRYVGVFTIAWIGLYYGYFFFRSGNGDWNLLWSGINMGDKLALLGRDFVNMWVSLASWYGLQLAIMTGLQAMTLVLLIFAWRHRDKENALDGASTGGIAAILGMLALGCPSCGLSLITPILTTLAGAGAAVMAEGVSNALLAIAFLLLFYTVIKLGYIALMLAGGGQRRK